MPLPRRVSGLAQTEAVTIDWEQAAIEASNRVALARAGVHEEEALQAAAEARATGPAARRNPGESQYWTLRAKVHAARRHRLSDEAIAEEAVYAFVHGQTGS
jgi:hypothetical protein